MYLGVDNIQDKTKQGLYSGIFLSKMAERERPFSRDNGSPSLHSIFVKPRENSLEGQRGQNVVLVRVNLKLSH